MRFSTLQLFWVCSASAYSTAKTIARKPSARRWSSRGWSAYYLAGSNSHISTENLLPPGYRCCVSWVGCRAIIHLGAACVAGTGGEGSRRSSRFCRTRARPRTLRKGRHSLAAPCDLRLHWGRIGRRRPGVDSVERRRRCRRHLGRRPGVGPRWSSHRDEARKAALERAS
jgi:hypothetical protein